jgi:hypothetical protein
MLKARRLSPQLALWHAKTAPQEPIAANSLDLKDFQPSVSSDASMGSAVNSLIVRQTSTGWLSVQRSNLVRDLLCPRIYVGPLAVVTRVPAESFEQQPSRCRPVIEINDPCKDTIVARVNRLFELADFSGRFLHLASSGVMESPTAHHPRGLAHVRRELRVIIDEGENFLGRCGN